MLKWPRYCELLLALWLAVSPWVLPEPAAAYRPVAWVAAVSIGILDVLAISGRVRYAFLLILLVAAGLLGFAFIALPPESAGTQNLITVSLLLGILAILPTEASLPPPSWRQPPQGRSI